MFAKEEVKQILYQFYLAFQEILPICPGLILDPSLNGDNGDRADQFMEQKRMELTQAVAVADLRNLIVTLAIYPWDGKYGLRAIYQKTPYLQLFSRQARMPVKIAEDSRTILITYSPCYIYEIPSSVCFQDIRHAVGRIQRYPISRG